ncbi:C4-dicarboxylate transporter DcuC [Kluyvera cryocrescens]|uniref:C4-dicarboxylate transporter DcuC n=1 Tax=Kluyvera cryocrescens TaxID=580 RepID=A0A485CJU9_KLUCR|nr:C4-dicarboxylate transporter DcuC [Kluyvera cryocrescens]
MRRFYAFVEMIPKLAHSSGINPAYLSIPMLQASNLGRTISPVSRRGGCRGWDGKNFTL